MGKIRLNLKNKDWLKVNKITVAKITGRYDWWKVNDKEGVYEEN